jgi:hypothetical protein
MYGIRPWELNKISIYNFNRLTKDQQTILDVIGVTGLNPAPSEIDIKEMKDREDAWLRRQNG